MLSLSRGWSASKKRWQLKCSQCLRQLPSANFPRMCGPAHLLVCAGCKRTCVMCGVRQLHANFSNTDTTQNTCNRCLAKEHVAQENVYFRYPILKYRDCPFSVDQMRETLWKERHE